MAAAIEPTAKSPYHLQLNEVPTFHPTAEEFTDPISYIASIRPEAERFGLARVVPPEGWSPPWPIKDAEFTFSTRVQVVNELAKHLGSARVRAFKSDYNAYLRHCGLPHKRWPKMGGMEIDLSFLHEVVRSFLV